MRYFSSLLAVLLATVGCSDTDDAAATSEAGSSGGSTGGLGSGGRTSGGTGGSATGSTTNVGGTAGDGGSGAGTGGATTGGTGGIASPPAVPSEGCGVGGRPLNGNVTGTNYVGSFPESYDGSTPMPMVLGLHAYGNPVTQIQSLTNGTRLAEKFVRIFPKSTDSGWDYGKDEPRIDAVLADVFSNYCVDLSRMYLTGHSSGAGMAVQLLCNGDTRFAGVAPVAAWKACNGVSAIPTMYIQGFADAQRGNGDGKDVVDVFASSNSCSMQTSPFDEVASCTSGFNGKPVDPGCVAYDGCGAPLIWCSHDDEGYNATDGHYHGWPCFASNAMADFFSSLP
jgi:poly(3-hydroxybutyrate) depolymerase